MLTPEKLLDYFRHYKTIPYFWKKEITLDFLKEFISLTNVGEERDKAVVFSIKLLKGIILDTNNHYVYLTRELVDGNQELISLGNNKKYILSKLTCRKKINISETFAKMSFLEELILKYDYHKKTLLTKYYKNITSEDILIMKKIIEKYYTQREKCIWNMYYFDFI